MDPIITGKNFSVFPNPSTGNFNLDLYFEDGEELEMTIYNSSAQVVDKKTLFSPTRLGFDLSRYGKGIYIIVIRSGVTAYREKIVIE